MTSFALFINNVPRGFMWDSVVGLQIRVANPIVKYGNEYSLNGILGNSLHSLRSQALSKSLVFFHRAVYGVLGMLSVWNIYIKTCIIVHW